LENKNETLFTIDADADGDKTIGIDDCNGIGLSFSAIQNLLENLGHAVYLECDYGHIEAKIEGWAQSSSIERRRLVLLNSIIEQG
jgi:hypothetical protein